MIRSDIEGPIVIDYDLRPGDAIEVTRGRESFSPFEFHFFEIGPFTVRTHIREDECARDAFARAQHALDDLARREYERRRGEFFERVESSHEWARKLIAQRISARRK